MGLGDAELGGELAGGEASGEPEMTESGDRVGRVGESQSRRVGRGLREQLLKIRDHGGTPIHTDVSSRPPEALPAKRGCDLYP